MTEATRTSRTIAVEHVRIASQRPFAEVRAALESSLSKLDSSIPAALRSGDQDRAKEYEASGPKKDRSVNESLEAIPDGEFVLRGRRIVRTPLHRVL